MRLAWLCAAALAVSSCGPSSLGPDLDIKVTNTVSDLQGMCGTSALSGLMMGTKSLRLTIVGHKADGSFDSFCDSVLGLTAGPTLSYRLPPGGGKLDIFAEAFDGATPPNRIATGTLLGVDPSHPPLPILYLFQTETFRCLGSARLNRTRAFHTATPLPNGQVLFLGGITAAVADDAPSNGTYFLTPTAEVYDPPSGNFFCASSSAGCSITESGTPAIARAFSTAALLPDTTGGVGPFKILVVGGIGSSGGSMPVLKDNTNQATGFRFVFSDATTPTAAPPELITYDPRAGTIVRSTPSLPNLGSNALACGTALQNPASGAATGMVVAGGASAFTTSAGHVVPTLTQKVDVTDGATVRDGPIPEGRLAGGVAQLDAATALLVGGIYDFDPAAMPPVTPKPLVRLLIGSATATALDASDPSFPNLQFSTVTPLLASGNVLVSGGLEVTGDRAINPPLVNGGMFLLSNGATGAMVTVKQIPAAAKGFVFDPTCTNAVRWRPVAWNAATQVPSGDRVLVTGGVPINDEAGMCLDCPGSDVALSCTVSQAGVVSLAPGMEQLSPILPAYDGSGSFASSQTLQFARFGHTQTVLPDGLILIAGGLTRDNRAAIGVHWAELWNPARRTIPPATTIGMSSSRADPDDPARAALAALSLSRDPALNAYANGGNTAVAASICSDPTVKK